VRVQNVRDFPQTKLDSEINAPFLLNEHDDTHFLFHYFNENNILNNWKKINTTEGDVTDPTAHFQIMFPLKDKNMQGIWRHFLWDVDE